MTQTVEPKTTSVTVEGVELSVPLEVQAAVSIVAAYRVDPEVSQTIIQDSGFKVRVGDDGLAGLAIVGMSYLQSVFGKYNEIGIVFDVENLANDENPTYIKWLPVTGEFTCAVGQQVWGFPKWVTDLRYTIFGEQSQVEWYENQALVLRLKVGSDGLDIGQADIPVSSYSIGPNGAQCTEAKMCNSGVIMDGSLSLEIGDSDHPAAAALRELKVADLEPAFTTAVSHSTSSWGLAQPR